MRRTILLAACVCCACNVVLSAEPTLPPPPAAPTSDVVRETRFGITTEDPYRRLEDLKDPEVQAWMKAQAARTRTILDAIPAGKAVLSDVERLSKAATARVDSAHLLADGRLLLQRKEADADISRLLLLDGIAGGKERVLVDPEEWRKRTGKPHAINYFEPSPDGKLLAFGISESGSEDATLHLIDMTTGKPLEAPITRVWFGMDWLPDSSGFVYNRINPIREGQPGVERMLNSQAYRHKLGTDAEGDPLVFGNRHDPALGIEAQQIPMVVVSDDGDYMLGFPSTVDNQVQLFVAPRAQLVNGPIQWRELIKREDHVRDFDLRGNDLFLMTSKSPSRSVERISLPDDKRTTLVPETPQRTIDDFVVRQDALYYTQRQTSGVESRLYRLPHDAAGPTEMALPGMEAFLLFPSQEGAPGLLAGSAGRSRFPVVIHVDAEGKVGETALQPQPRGVAAGGVEVTTVEVPSHDGTSVPLSIMYLKGTPRNGANPTLLQGYGAYGISPPPYLSPAHFAYYNRGFVRAYCHVRGGGEKGEAWYRAGFQATKANTWKDFNACAQYLVDQRFTSPAKLAALGGSAGGILIGNAMVERPDLYRVMFPEVGVLDAIGAAIRDQNGPSNWAEFGDPNTEAGYKSLYAMNSYRKVKDGTAYPATMLIHGVTDPRVAVWQSSKMAARLQQASTSGLPVLLRLDYEAGHGIGSTQIQENQERADIISFMLWQFGDPKFAPVLSMEAADAAVANP